MRRQSGVMTGNIVVGHGGGIVLAAPTSSAPPGPDPETASAIVAGAGTASSNGTYARSGSTDGKASYQLSDNRIFWSAAPAQWNIEDYIGLEAVAYISSEDVAYPWLVTTWTVAGGSEPAPTVTIG